jgi:hypothetical protein
MNNKLDFTKKDYDRTVKIKNNNIILMVLSFLQIPTLFIFDGFEFGKFSTMFSWIFCVIFFFCYFDLIKRLKELEQMNEKIGKE